MKSLQKDKYTGAKGGKATLKEYGREHFSKLAKKRWKKYKIVLVEDTATAVQRVKKMSAGAINIKPKKKKK